MSRLVLFMALLALFFSGCTSQSKPSDGPIVSTGRIAPDPVAAVRSVLPQGWRIYRVEENSFPFYLKAGNGKAIRLADPTHRADKPEHDMIIYIMPADYDDGGVDFTRGDTVKTPPTLLATAADAKIYLWGHSEQWPTAHEDLLKALVVEHR